VRAAKKAPQSTPVRKRIWLVVTRGIVARPDGTGQ
jgi:hypothetical protein